MRDRDMRERLAGLESQVRCLARSDARTHRELVELQKYVQQTHRSLVHLLLRNPVLDRTLPQASAQSGRTSGSPP